LTTQAPRGDTNGPHEPLSERVSELETSFGQLMASQAAIAAGWRGARHEYETFARSVTQLERRIAELLEEQKTTRKVIRRLSRFAPLALALVEIGRHLLERFSP
jgi:chromosome segregation ATPase